MKMKMKRTTKAIRKRDREINITSRKRMKGTMVEM